MRDHNPSNFLTLTLPTHSGSTGMATGLQAAQAFTSRPRMSPGSTYPTTTRAPTRPSGGVLDRAQGATVVKALEEVLLAALPAETRARIGR